MRLSDIAGNLEEKISLHATHKRLSRNPGKEGLDKAIIEKTLSLGSGYIGQDTLLIVDPSDITKKYAKEMEYLGRVWDASEKIIGNGYWFCQVVGCETGTSQITPLAQSLWSQESPDFKSENKEILDIVQKVHHVSQGRGIFVIDRGGDRRRLLAPWTKDASFRYLARQKGDRHLLYKNKPKSCFTLAGICKTPYAEKLMRIKGGKEEFFHVHFGFLPVRLPECPDRPLCLVVVKGFGKKPLMLLTTEPMRRNLSTVLWAVNAYLTRWRIEDTIRFVKQSYDLEDVRVLTFRRLKNLSALVFAASYFASCWMGVKDKLWILRTHLLVAARRIFGIPDFCHYALADGIKNVFKRVGNGAFPKKPPKKQIPGTHYQLSIFDI